MNRVIFDKERCKGCGLCVFACPLKILELDGEVLNGKGYHPAKIVVPEKCAACACCAIMCPDAVITVIKE